MVSSNDITQALFHLKDHLVQSQTAWQRDDHYYLHPSLQKTSPAYQNMKKAEQAVNRVAQIKGEILEVAVNLQEMDIFDGGTKLTKLMALRDELLVILGKYLPEEPEDD